MKRYWSWPITLDLFLGGVGGGSLFVAMVLRFVFGELGFVFAFVALAAVAAYAVALFFLVFELGQPPQFYRAFVTATAVIKWGAVFLSVSLVFAFLYCVSFLPLSWLGFLIPLRSICMVIAGISGVGVMLYAGLMLASCKSHAFWASPAIPVLFIVSGIAMGAAVCLLSIGVFANLFADMISTETLYLLVVSYTILGIVAIVATSLYGIILLLYVLSLRGAGNEVARTIAERWIRGPYALLFWGVVIFGGVLVPIALFVLGDFASLTAAVLLLVTGLVLRFMIVFSDGRRLVPGEKRFYGRLPHRDAEFLTAWKDRENLY